MAETSYASYAYYLGDEVRYGCYLYYAGWKKLLLHPWQTVKDTAYAAYHPIETGKILLNQVKQHPIGVTVNLSLSWTTGQVIGTGMEYLESLVPEIEYVSNLPTLSQAQNATTHAESLIPSILSEAVQVGSQVMSGGCCGGVCTISRIGGQTTIFTQPSEPAADNGQKATETAMASKKSSSLLSYFWKASPREEKKACHDSSCAITKNCLEDYTQTSELKMH